MHSDFSRCLSLLRQEKGISQRAAAKDLGISQALLSHYENGVREPGLAFVTRACDYYNVSADFLLGRTLTKDGSTIVSADELYDAVGVLDKAIAGSDSPADAEAAAFYMKNEVLPAMQDVRAVSDALETNIGREYWPFPVYGDIILH